MKVSAAFIHDPAHNAILMRPKQAVSERKGEAACDACGVMAHTALDDARADRCNNISLLHG